MRHGAIGAPSLARSSFSNHPSLSLNPRPRYSLRNGGASLRFPNFIPAHHRFRSHCTTNQAPSLELPLLPFGLNEVISLWRNDQLRVILDEFVKNSKKKLALIMTVLVLRLCYHLFLYEKTTFLLAVY